MEHIEYNKGKRKIVLFHGIGLAVMLAIGFIAFPYLDASLADAVGREKFTESHAIYVKYFILLCMPAMPLLVILMSLFIPTSDEEKIAQAKNMPRFIPINFFLVLILIVAHIGMQLFITLPKAMFEQYAEMILTGVYVLLSLVMLWVANIVAKNTKSLWSGFPTPWNQKSELAWEKSQRFMGFGLAISSFANLIMAFIWPIGVPIIMGVGLAMAYGGCFIVSYYVYTQEQHYLNQQLQNGGENDQN